MFVLSVKSKKLRTAAIAFIVTLSVGLAVLGMAKTGADNKVSLNDGAVSFRAENEKDRIAFFSQFGWEIDEEPLGVKEIVIPEEFDDEFEKYNEIQKKQKFDLKDYKGKRAKRWTYKVNNFTKNGNNVEAVGSIIVFNSAVIGGDISTTENGKQEIHTFDVPQNGNELTTEKG